MSEPKRPWFRFHLSTLVVLSVVAGGLLWANVKPKITIDYSGSLPPIDEFYGWPFTALHWTNYVTLDYSRWRPIGLFGNFWVALAILATVAFACEWWIRKRVRALPFP